MAAEKNNPFTSFAVRDKDERKRFAEAESDFRMVFRAEILPKEPFLFAIHIVGKEIDHSKHSRLSDDSWMSQPGHSLQPLPQRIDSLQEANTKSTGPGGFAQLFRIDFRGRQQPTAPRSYLRAIR